MDLPTIPPSSHGSDGGNVGIDEVRPEDGDGFDSEEFREFLRVRERRRTRGGRRNHADSDGSSDRAQDDRSNSGPPPDWDGESCSFQDYAIKARLWLATTKARPKTRGPLLMQKLSKVPFEATKFLAKDQEWMNNPKNGEALVDLMDKADMFGEDKEEDLLSSLARVTYHLRREKTEGHRAFFSRWDVAMRKVAEHRIKLPDLYVGFLLINAMALTENEIKNLLNYTRGSVDVKDVKEWTRKHETKLQVSQVGIDSKKVLKPAAVFHTDEVFDEDEAELHSIEEALRELQGDEGRSDDTGGEDDLHVLEEHEAAEILATMVQKKKSYLQSVQSKKFKELGRGYRGRPHAPSTASSSSSRSTMPLKPGKFHAHIDGQLTIQELKKITRCGHCKQVGHWWKECPKKNQEKETHHLESEEAIFCGWMEETDDGLPPGEEQLTCSRLSQDPDQDHQVSHGLNLTEVADECSPTSEMNSYEIVSARAAYNDRYGNSPEMEIHFAEGRGDQTPKPQKLRELDIPEEACATIDTGCQRMAIGYETLQKLANYLPDELSVGLIPQEHRFRSVHGRSSTTHVASLPTSIGPKGSLLRPAVFENVESRKAPFLISLPFLLFCRTVLYLDPEVGLKAYFRKLDFTVKCHLGPSGALRIPLCEFTSEKKSKLQEAQREFCERTGEFEVLKISENPETPCDVPSDFQSCHGAAIIQEEPIPDVSEPVHAELLVSSGPQGDVRSTQDQRDDDLLAEDALLHGRERLRAGIHVLGTVRKESRHLASPTIDSQPKQPHEERLQCSEQQCSEQFQHDCPNADFTGGTTSSRTTGGTLTCLPPSTTTACTPSGSSTAGRDQQSPDVPLPDAVPTSPMPTWRRQLSPDLLEVPDVSRGTMRVLPMVPESTNLEQQGDPHRWPSTGESLRQGAHRDRPEYPTTVPTLPNNQSGNQCIQEDHQVCDVRQDSERGVHGVGQVKEGQPGEEELREAFEKLNSPERRKKLKRTVKQAVSALKCAEAMWQDLSYLIGCSDSTQPENAVDVLRAKCLPHLPSTERRCKKSLKQAANLLGRPQMKPEVVAELFNPRRFGEHAESTGLQAGEAFDLLLGHNLLDHKERERVRKYVAINKPGLTCVSPPCTLFSLLQNLNLKHLDTENKLKEYARRLTEAKVLLNFGVEICQMVAAYGGSFLFEQPLTSKAWKEPKVLRLLNDLRNQLAKNDQCVFNLRSTTGGLRKKPTGWLTNNEMIYEALNIRCPGDHQHEQVLGGGPGGSRSKLAQHYTPELVRTVLSAYRRSLKRPTDVQLLSSETYLKECQDVEKLLWRSEENVDAEMPANDIAPAENLVVKDEEAPTNDKVTTNTAVLKNDEVVKNVDHENYAAEIDQEEATDEGQGEDKVEEKENADEPYKMLPRERPFSTEQLVRRAHNGLGHPAPDKLVRILKEAKASPEAIQAARSLRCEVCEKHQSVRPCRAAAPPRELTFNQIVGVDTVWLPGPEPGGKHKMALNIIDWCTRFQLMIPLRDHTPRGARRALLQWIRLFGPPERIYDDLGKEFRGAFADFMEEQSIFLDPASLETPEQRGITERAGKIFKEILAKTLHEISCEDWETWSEVVMTVNATINRLSNRSGFSPCQRVFGFNPRLPGGLMTGGGNDHSTISRYQMGDAAVQNSMRIRQAAAQAFHKSDCQQSLRNALQHGPRRRIDYEVGQIVYFWRKGMQRALKDNSSFWRRPAKVILTSPPNSVWLAFQGYVVKAAPEHLRVASIEERMTLTGWIDDIVSTRKKLEEDPSKGYIVLDEPPPREERPPLEENPVPRHQIIGKTPADQIQFRAPKKPRLMSREDIPEGLEAFQEPVESPASPELDLGSNYAPTTPRSETIEDGGNHGPQTESVQPTEPEKPVEPADMEISENEEENQNRGITRGSDPTFDEEVTGPPAKRSRNNFVEIYYTKLENFNVFRQRKEVRMKQLTEDEKKKFQQAMAKEVKNNFESGAYKLLSPQESEKIRRSKPDKILKSRYVLTKKPLEPEEVEKIQKEALLIEDTDCGVCKAKARHVMQGFSEHGSEDLPSTTPQVAKDSVIFVLQNLCSRQWDIGNLDFTQAFHSGDSIQRELYSEQPLEGLPMATTKRQLLVLQKTCCGLTDGPYQWYCHISRVLSELGYTVSKADPCLYYLHADDQLQGLIALATDDMIHGGTELHWNKMRTLQERYKMGKFATGGGGRFSGKDIVRNPDGSYLVHQQFYIEEKLEKYQLGRDRARQRYSRCTPEEISTLRGLIGGIAWVAKETRPDIAGRVALLQQCMPEPQIHHLIEANSIISELKKTPKVGILIQPIPIQHLRIGVVTDASWGNTEHDKAYLEDNQVDRWEETPTTWIRHHYLPRSLLFHPAAAPGGPDLHQIGPTRNTYYGTKKCEDEWNTRDSIRPIENNWTGQTVFMKENVEKEKQKPINERYLQLNKTGSQGGYLVIYYDERMEYSEEPCMVTIAAWKSYKLKRCTVNTLSAECQSMLQGIGQVHWHRFLLCETQNVNLELHQWEAQLSRLPFIAVTDSRSLYDTINKCRNSSAHIDDKRTAIDLSILKGDLVQTKGQVRWIEGKNMISDTLTKKMCSSFLRNVMVRGDWSLHENGFKALADLHMLWAT